MLFGLGSKRSSIFGLKFYAIKKLGHKSDSEIRRYSISIIDQVELPYSIIGARFRLGFVIFKI